MLESFGFASGLLLPLGIITTLVNDWVHLQNRNNPKKYQYPSTLHWVLKILNIHLLIDNNTLGML